MATIQHVASLESPPIIGQRYWVPCVRLGRTWWPVSGQAHRDVELGVPEEHLHTDGRFLSAQQVLRLLNRVLAAAMLVADSSFLAQSGVSFEAVAAAARRTALAPALAVNLTLPTSTVDEAALRIRVCEREVPPTPTAVYLPQLEASFADARAPDCRTCPHRGTPLTSLPADDEGGVVCPAHGLRWSRSSGRLMPRAPRPPNAWTEADAARYREALRQGDPL